MNYWRDAMYALERARDAIENGDTVLAAAMTRCAETNMNYHNYLKGE